MSRPTGTTRAKVPASTYAKPAPRGRMLAAKPAPRLAPWLLAGWILPAVAAVATFVGLASVLFATFGFLDDYAVLYQRETNPQPNIDAAIVQGRPVAGLLQGAAFLVVDDIGGFALMRLFSVLCLAAFAAVGVREMVRLGYGGAVAMIFAAMLLVLPSTAVMSSWAILLMGPVGLLLGLLAAVSASRQLESFTPSWREPMAVLRRGAVPTLLLLAGLLAYQPSAMVFWPALVLLLGAPSRRAWVSGRLLVAGVFALLLGAVASTAGYAAVKVGVLYVGGDVPRTALTSDVVDKVDYLFRSVLPRAFDPLATQPRADVALLSALLLLTLLVAVTTGAFRRRLTVLLLVGAALVLSYLPSLMTAENWASARSMSALYVVPLVGVALVLQGLVDRWSIPVVARAGVSALLFVGCVVWSTHILTTFWTGPQAEELKRAQQSVAPALTGDPASVVVLRSDYTQTLAPDFSFDEAGIPSTYASWVPVPLTQLLAREQTGQFLDDVKLVDRAALPSLAAGTVVVDYGSVLAPMAGPPVTVVRLP